MKETKNGSIYKNDWLEERKIERNVNVQSDRNQTTPNSRNVSATDAITGYPNGSIRDRSARLVGS